MELRGSKSLTVESHDPEIRDSADCQSGQARERRRRGKRRRGGSNTGLGVVGNGLDTSCVGAQDLDIAGLRVES